MTQEEMDALPSALEVTLSAPVDVAGAPVGTVTVREPTRGQMREIAKQPVDEQTDYAIFTCSGLLPAAVKQLKARDWHKISEWLAPFFQGPTAAPSAGGART